MEPITVVTASVNRKGLARTMASVQAQTLKPVKHCILFQQLIMNGSGYSDSDEPILNLRKPHSVPLEIVWLPPPQPHIVDVLNMAEEMATTSWVAMLDDDCWWEPDHLETLAGLMDEIGADFVWGSTQGHDDETGAPTWRRDSSIPKFGYIDTNEILFRRECREKWGGFWMEDHRGVDGRRIERWVRNGAIYAHSSKVTVHYGDRKVPAFP